MMKRKLKLAATLLYFCIGALFYGCQEPTNGKNTDIILPNDTQDAGPLHENNLAEAELILASSNEIYLFDDDNAESQSLALGSAWVKKYDGNFKAKGFEYDKKLDAQDFLGRYKTDNTLKQTDLNGAYSRFELDLVPSIKDIEYLQKGALAGDASTLAVVRNSFTPSTGKGGSAVELRSIADVDASLKGLSYSGKQGKTMGDFIGDLKRDDADPGNPLRIGRPYATFGLDPLAADAALISSRIRHEFGNRFLVQQIGPGEFRISRFQETLMLEFRFNDAARFLGGMTQSQMKKGLADPKMMAAGQSTIIIAPRGKLSQADLESYKSSGLYDNFQEVDLKRLTHSNKLDPRLLGSQDVVAYFVKRKAGGAGPLAVPKFEDAVANKDAFYKQVDELTNDFIRPEGHHVVVNPEVMANAPIPRETLGKGTYGEVLKVERGNIPYAQKTMLNAVDINTGKELSYAIALGKYDIGVPVHDVSTTNGKINYTLDLGVGDAGQVKMNQNHIISYGVRQTKLRELGLLHLDDKPGNIIVRGDQAYMNDFGFMKRGRDGELPALRDYGTFAPYEGLTASRSNSLLAPQYRIAHTQSFFYGFNVIYSRLGSSFLNLAEAKRAIARVEGRWTIDGDKLGSLKDGNYHVRAGMSKEAFGTLVDMMQNNYTKRPSVDSFINSFQSTKFVTN